MHDVAMRRRLAALVIAALLAIAGAALTSAVLATDQTLAVHGNRGEDDTLAVGNTGAAIGQGDAQAYIFAGQEAVA